jgi:hypothetical protein
MKINPDKSKAVRFTRTRVKDRLRYYFWDQLIPEANSFKYHTQRSKLGRSCKLYATEIMEDPSLYNAHAQTGNNNSNRLGYTSLVSPIRDYGAVCWDHTEMGR